MKKIVFALLLSTGVVNLVSWLNRKKVTILCYHNVVLDDGCISDDALKLELPVHLFLKHLDYLTTNYSVVSLNDFLKSKRENQPLPDYSVVLIFDDGYKEFNTVVATELRKRNLPATVFLITDLTGGSLPAYGEEEFLSWHEVQELASTGIHIGSHTCSHACLVDLPLEEVRKELAEAKIAILRHVAQDSVPLSYPYGLTTEPISQIAQSVGYSCAIADGLGPNGSEVNMFSLTRTVVSSEDDVVTFAARVSGLTFWAPKLRQLIGKTIKRDDRSAVQQYKLTTPRSYVAD